MSLWPILPCFVLQNAHLYGLYHWGSLAIWLIITLFQWEGLTDWKAGEEGQGIYSSTYLPARLRASSDYIPLLKATVPVRLAAFSYSCKCHHVPVTSLKPCPLKFIAVTSPKCLSSCWFPLTLPTLSLNSLQAPHLSVPSISCQNPGWSSREGKKLIKNYIGILREITENKILLIQELVVLRKEQSENKKDFLKIKNMTAE